MESLIEACNVTDAKEVYEILGQEKIEISIQLKQDYLEMLCFHNSNDEEMEEDFNETKGVMTVNQNKWIAGKFVMEEWLAIYCKIPSSHRAICVLKSANGNDVCM